MSLPTDPYNLFKGYCKPEPAQIIQQIQPMILVIYLKLKMTIIGKHSSTDIVIKYYITDPIIQQQITH